MRAGDTGQLGCAAGPRRQVVGQSEFGRDIDDLGYPVRGAHLNELFVRGWHLGVLRRLRRHD